MKSKPMLCTCEVEQNENEIHLIVREDIKHTFELREDGSYKLYETECAGQEIYGECICCGTRYELDDEWIELHQEPVFMRLVNPMKSSLDYEKINKIKLTKGEIKNG